MKHTIETIARATIYHQDYDLWHIKYEDGSEQFNLHSSNWDTCSPEDSGTVENYAMSKEEAIEKFKAEFKNNPSARIL